MAMRLYIGNLSFTASDTDLQTLFTQAGQVTSAKVITDVYTGRSRGFAFVEMASRDDGQRAIDQFNGKPLKGRPIIVNEARPPMRRSGGDAGASSPAATA
jgi:RNA recognition motif-containing protein